MLDLSTLDEEALEEMQSQRLRLQGLENVWSWYERRI